MADPNFNCKIEVVKNIVEPGIHEGATFFDCFKLKKDEDGDWAFLRYSKLGKLINVRYGAGWHDDPKAEFEESDFEDFEFIAQVEPKTDSKGKSLTGSVINWKSMRPASEAGAEEKAEEEKVAEAEAEEAEDFQDIPF